MGARSAAGERGPRRDDADHDLTRIAGAHVLLVEDNEINQQVAREILEGAGISVTLADYGLEGVDAVKTGRFDAVLMDIQMPVMDGHSAAREIRAWEQSQRPKSKSQIPNPGYQAEGVPIIAMTAHAMAGDAEKSLAAGMNGHITKPIDPDHLFAELVKWIRPGQRPDEPRSPAAVSEIKPAGDAEDLPETLAGFDLPEGLKRLQGNRALYRKLILKFADSCRDGMAQIEKAIKTRNHDEIMQLAHSIKGSAGNLAARDLQDAAMGMEHLIKDHPDAPPSADDLNAACAELGRAVDTIFAAADALGGVQAEAGIRDGDITAGIPPEDRQGLAARIRDAAEMGDMTELQAIAAELDARIGDQQSLGRRIDELAEGFDLEGLAQLADDLAPT
jgi:CheY-like chemotaxis protein